MKVSLWSVAAIVLLCPACDKFDQLKAGVSTEVHHWTAKSPSPGSSGSADWAHDDGVDGGLAMTEAPPARCTLPRHEDDYFGFSIGYPPGWLVDYTTGSIVVAKDANELEGAMVYPARLHRAVAAEDVATAFAQGLGRSITARGGTFAMSDKHTNGKIARATLKATVGGVALEGPLEVVDRRSGRCSPASSERR
jgi:hypothetical protein